MAVETLARGSQNGYGWIVDHDDVAGTIGITVTGTSPQPGNLTLNGELFREPAHTQVGTIQAVRIDGFVNQGRQVLFTSANLVGIVMVQPKGTSVPFSLSFWTSFSA